MHDHVHQWIPHLEDAFGFYQKREGTEIFSCRGRVFSCSAQPCPTYLFVPHNKEFSPSEAEAVESHLQLSAEEAA